MLNLVGEPSELKSRQAGYRDGLSRGEAGAELPVEAHHSAKLDARIMNVYVEAFIKQRDDACGAVVLNEIQDALQQLQTRSQSFKDDLARSIALEWPKVESSDNSARQLATEFRKRARELYPSQPAEATGLFFISAYFEASGLPGEKAALASLKYRALIKVACSKGP